MSANETEKLIRKVQSLLDKVPFKGIDLIQFQYLTATKLATYLNKRRETLKPQLLEGVQPERLKDLEILQINVEQTEVSSSIRLLTGRYFDTIVQIKAGNPFVDFEALRKVLKLSERRFNFAMKQATRRRPPTLTYNVTEK